MILLLLAIIIVGFVIYYIVENKKIDKKLKEVEKELIKKP